MKRINPMAYGVYGSIALFLIVVFVVTCTSCATQRGGYDVQVRGMVGYGNSFTPKYVSYGKQNRQCRKAERHGL